MFASDLLNASSGATDIRQSINSTNLSEIFLNSRRSGLDAHCHSFAREWILLTMSLLSVFGHVVALFMHAQNIDRRRESWFCTTHLLFAGLLIGYVPMLSQTSFETQGRVFFGGEMVCALVTIFRTYFLTLSTYILVMLSLNCYSIVVKPLIVSPAPFVKLYSVMVGFYAISTGPSLFIYILRNLNSTEVKPYCIPYFFYTWQFTQYPELINMAILLIFIYIVPLFLIIIFLGRVLFELWTRSSFFYSNKQASLYVSKYDCRFIKMSFAMCLAFVVTSAPFVILGITIVFINPNLIDANTAVLVEILSVGNACLNPYILIMFEFKQSCVRCLACTENSEGKLACDHNDNQICRCCYEPVSSEAAKGSFVKLINNAPHTEAVTFPSDNS